MSLLAVAEEAAVAAGELLRERFEAGVERALRTKSTPTDLVFGLAMQGALPPGDSLLVQGGLTPASRGLTVTGIVVNPPCSVKRARKEGEHEAPGGHLGDRVPVRA